MKVPERPVSQRGAPVLSPMSKEGGQHTSLHPLLAEYVTFAHSGPPSLESTERQHTSDALTVGAPGSVANLGVP